MACKFILPALILLCMVCSCLGSRKQQKNPFYVKKSDYVTAYKTAFMSGCLYASTNGNFYSFLQGNNDLGLFTEADLISHVKVNEADSLGRIYAKKIPLFTYGDGAGKLPGFSRCMVFTLSKEVDSIAKATYRRYVKTGSRK